MALNIEIGKKYGKLTVIKEGEKLRLPSGQTNRTVVCKCDCGNTKQVRLLHLVRERTLSCGCSIGVFHGDCKKKIYARWKSIIYRCYKSPYESSYFDNNIGVCDEWRNDYMSFKKWALSHGYSDELQIDRRDNKLGYSPDNCRFVTNTVNVNNRSNTFIIEYGGAEIPFMNLIYQKGLEANMTAIRTRIKRGWSPQRAFDVPIHSGNYVRVNNSRDEVIEALHKYNNHKHNDYRNDRRMKKRIINLIND